MAQSLCIQGDAELDRLLKHVFCTVAVWCSAVFTVSAADCEPVQAEEVLQAEQSRLSFANAKQLGPYVGIAG